MTLLIGSVVGVNPAVAEEQVRIGVLAKRGADIAEKQWQPTADHLSKAISGYDFQIVPLNFDAIVPSVEAGTIDFVLTNPSFYVELEMRYGISRIATLKNDINGQVSTQFGGVIFTQADNHHIATLQDLKGKRFMAVQDTSLGGYQIAWGVLRQEGIEPTDDFAQLQFGGTHDAVVHAVLRGTVDAGTVRSDTLERMAQEGIIDLSQIRIINAQNFDDYPFLISTPLYPEWPFAKLKKTSNQLSDQIASVLLSIPPSSEAAEAGRYLGWSVPHNYQPVHRLLKNLRIGPYAYLDQVTLEQLLQRYWHWLVLVLIALMVLSTTTIHVLNLNRRLLQSGEALQAAHDTLEVRVDERTRDLNDTLRELDALHKRQHTVLNTAADGIYGIDLEGRTTFVNQAAKRMLGFTSNELIGEINHHLIHHSRADGSSYPDHECRMYGAIHHRQPQHVVDEVLWRKDGSSFPVEYISSPVIDDEGEAKGAIITFRDVSERKQTEQKLRLAAIAMETSEAIIITDPKQKILQVNHAFTEITGYEADEVIGKTPNLLNSGRHDEAFFTDMWHTLEKEGRWEGEVWNRRKNGEVYPEWLTVTAVTDDTGEITHYVGSFLDITERKASEARIKYQAYYDALTDLPNRRLLLDRLEQSIVRSRRHNHIGALLFLDLDHFKTINDSLGHPVGDALLQEVARRLRTALRKEDTAARLGGDEFIILLPEVSDDTDEAITQAQEVAEKVLRAITKRIEIKEHQLHVTTSIGITLFPVFSDDPNDILKYADTAMYRAKERGRNTYQFYLPTMQEAADERLTLEKELHEAIDQEQLLLNYQPQYDHEGHIVGAEALLRWENPHRGMVSPADFIPLAEETGLILPIGRWVLDKACEMLVSLAEKGCKDVRIAVNVSPRQFRQSDFINEVKTVLDRTGIKPHLLELELTEGMLLADIEETIHKMQALQQLGVRFAIDDFGTGYSSLSYLKQLPLDILKVDQSFVSDITTDPNDAAIVETILSMARHLKLEVVAEGVEQEEEFRFLQENGCHIFQGYYFSRPVTEEMLLELLDKNRMAV